MPSKASSRASIFPPMRRIWQSIVLSLMYASWGKASGEKLLAGGQINGLSGKGAQDAKLGDGEAPRGPLATKR